ncbi:MAG: heme o synthase [Deltaproteobacteria bacterium]
MTNAATPVSDLLELTKPRITLMVVITTAAGYWLAAPQVAALPFAATLLGTALIAAGASCLNQVIEIRTDALMERTRKRPMAAGRTTRRTGAILGVLLSLAGTLVLAVATNWLTAGLGLLTLLLYTLVYTPMKRVSSLCTVVGAVPGAIPPMMGWTAVTGDISVEAWVLFGILFFWQMPHFLAIAWMYRDDYERGLQPMLPVADNDGSATARQILLYSLGLLPVSLLPAILGMAGGAYFSGALVLGLIFLISAIHTARVRSLEAARLLLRVSVIYLPLLLLLLAATKGPMAPT